MESQATRYDSPVVIGEIIKNWLRVLVAAVVDLNNYCQKYVGMG